MRKRLGTVLILLSFVVTFVCWSFVQPLESIPITRQYSELVATMALVGFAWVNFISTRHVILEKWFNGLDKTYIYHKYLSIISLILVVIHQILFSVGKRLERKHVSVPRLSGDTRNGGHIFITFGTISMILFIALVIFALLAKKLNYERWKLIHKIMFVPYIIGLMHYYGSSNYAVFGLDPFSIYINIINLIGTVSVIYSIFIYEKNSFKYRFKVEKLKFVAKGMLEITGKAVGRSMEFLPGQFAFLKLIGKENNFPSHPFTISQAPKKGEIQFTIKALGDHTKKLLDTVKVGDEFVVSGPHGKFSYRTGSKKQIWIAGGIGITPFRSFYQSDIPEDYSIDFFYAFNNKDEGAYVEEIMEMPPRNNLKIHLLNSQEEGFLSAEKIAKYVNNTEPVDVYFCGPKPMREILRKQLADSQFNIIDFYYEHFEFK
jgi:predicted ferric reductase